MGRIPKVNFDERSALQNWDNFNEIDGVVFSSTKNTVESDIYFSGSLSIQRFRNCINAGGTCGLLPHHSLNVVPLEEDLGHKYRFNKFLYEDPKLRKFDYFYPKSYGLFEDEDRELFLSYIEESYGPSLSSQGQCCLECEKVEEKKNDTCPIDPDLWLMKPGSRGLGNGIFLIDPKYIDDLVFELYDEHTLDFIRSDHYIAQKYVKHPFLYKEQHKCSIRKFFLILSIDPLLVLQYHDCVIMCGAVQYSIKEGYENEEIVITNAHAHRKYGDIRPRLNVADYYEYIRTVENLKKSKDWVDHFDRETGSIAAYISKRLRDKLLTELPFVFQPNDEHPHFFDLLALDIVLDDELKIWVTEIQSTPSLVLGHEKIADVMVPMVTELFSIVHETRKIFAESERSDTTPRFNDMTSLKDFKWVVQRDKTFYPNL